MTEASVGPLQLEKHIFPKQVYRKYKTQSINTKPLEPNSLEKRWGIILHKEKAYTTKDISSQV
jgi:hypothetical protein